jgi:phenylpropionate dioxygenase-like ring-hydroxylating dioxygenase large terminal subunit
MRPVTFAVDPDITVASTLDAAFYRDEAAFALARERVFGRSWQWIGDLTDVAQARSLAPRALLHGILDEPLLLVRDAAGALRCLSNVCTHRGNILVGEARTEATDIRCGYHSRRFDLSGRMTFMPEFGLAKNFPSPADDLAAVPFASWANQGFAAIDPAAPLDAFVGDMAAQVASLPVDRFRADPDSNRDYVIHAHWALYVENYLEGFHIPFVHPALNRTVDYASYADRLFRYSSLQLAQARDREAAFDVGTIASDGRDPIAACYWWIFPNLMLNFYPWGMSLNRVVPEAIDRTRVEFRTYVGDEAKRGRGAGGALQEVEMEDEAVVEAVQRGVRSRFYRGGRYSPSRERGTHHFHRLLCEFMRES